ncbi:alpha-keto acid decarboxylase family protein [Mycolicibacterium sp. Dal123E01]|uniref:alpha-keto acid decarboxylase family protein n=1 Tax=Mycolicibacterium sp. Dal123E01 TaxID=3457578 RepID=UPI00403EC00E
MRIGDFLLRRLSEIGTTHIFGVPGDYNMSFLDQLEGHQSIQWVGTCNELNAAYAADGHARSGKPGVLLTTYGVGCLSAINGVAGAYCEHVPLIHISGSPPSHAVHDRVSLHHSLLDGGYRNVHRAFTEFTEYAATISPLDAVHIIDHALVTAFRHRRPVRLELPSDLTHVEIDIPYGVLTIIDEAPNTPQIADAAETLARELARSQRPLLLFDLPAVRWNAVETIQEFCATLDIPFGCTAPATHQITKPSPQYLGVLPSADHQGTLASADLVIACGLNISDVTTSGFTLDLSDKTIAKLTPAYTQIATEGSSVPAVYYGAGLGEVLAATLPKVAGSLSTRERWWPAPAPTAVEAEPEPSDDPVTEQFFFSRLESFVREGDVLIAETGTSGQNTVGLSLPVPIRYINQSSWGSIGYALPALLGAFTASPQRRHILCTGDGSFQVTAQELSTIIRHGFTPIIFLLNNSGYTIERAILGKHSPYNDVANWTYRDIPKVFGIDEDHYLYRSCETRSDVESALGDCADATSLCLVEIKLAALDMPEVTSAVGNFTRRYDYGTYGPANE